MENTKKIPQYNLIAGIIFIVLAVFQLLGLESINRLVAMKAAASIIPAVLTAAAYAFMAVALLMKKRDITLIGASAAIVLVKLIDFFVGFGSGIYEVYDWNYYSDDTYTFNFFCMLPAIVLIAAAVCLFAIAAITLRDSLAAKLGEEKAASLNALAAYDGKLKQLWFAPAAGVGGTVVLALITYFLIEINNTWYYVGAFANLHNILLCVAFVFAALWIVHPEGLPKSEKEEVIGGDGYCGLVKHALLLVFTFGIWMLIWVYRVTKYLNQTKGSAYRNPTNKLLLFMFVPLYSVYWVYKSAMLIDKHAKDNDVYSDVTMPSLFLSCLAPIVAFIIMQDKINEISLVNAPAPASAAPAAAPRAAEAPVHAAPSYTSEPAAPAGQQNQPAHNYKIDKDI